MRDGYVIGAWNTNVGVIDSSSAFVEANEAVESFVVCKLFSIIFTERPLTSGEKHC